MKLYALFFLLCSILSPMSHAIEEPEYKVIKKYDTFEVRQYADFIVAEVFVKGTPEEVGNIAFKYLGGYIFGKNKGERKIEMTAPVTQVAAPIKIAMTAPLSQVAVDNGYVVQFTMPKEFTMATLPEPNDPKVKLREVAGQKYAVIRYSGTWSQENYEEKLKELKLGVENAGLKVQGEPVFARYNGPISLPFLRRNEVWLMLVE